MLVFFSGWAGFTSLYPYFAQKYTFLVPFQNIFPEDIISFWQNKKLKICLGWSTGAHLLLKNFAQINSDYLFLISPFLNFTSCISELWLKKTQQSLKLNPQLTLNKFYSRLGAAYKVEHISKEEVKNLLLGLNFLASSQIKEVLPNSQIKKIYLLYGQKDKLINLQETQTVAQKLSLPKDQLIFLDQGHYLTQEKLLDVLKKKTNCPDL